MLTKKSDVYHWYGPLKAKIFWKCVFLEQQAFGAVGFCLIYQAVGQKGFQSYLWPYTYYPPSLILLFRQSGRLVYVP